MTHFVARDHDFYVRKSNTRKKPTTCSMERLSLWSARVCVKVSTLIDLLTPPKKIVSFFSMFSKWTEQSQRHHKMFCCHYCTCIWTRRRRRRRRRLRIALGIWLAGDRWRRCGSVYRAEPRECHSSFDWQIDWLMVGLDLYIIQNKNLTTFFASSRFNFTARKKYDNNHKQCLLNTF